MTQQHTIATAALTDRQMAEEMEAINGRLRARIIDLSLQVDALRDVNKALSAENDRSHFEAKRLRELAEQRRLDLVECRENMRGIRRHK